MSNEVFMKRLVRTRKIKTEKEKLDEIDSNLQNTREIFTELKEAVTDLGKQIESISKQHELERKKELAKGIDTFR